MDENIKFIREQLERGIVKFKEIDGRLDDLDKVASKHEELMREHPGICKAIEALKLKNSEEKGVIKGVSSTAVIVVGILNILIMIYQLLPKG